MAIDSEAVEATVAAVASKTTYWGSAGAIIGWLASSEGTVVLGLLFAGAGLLVNWYYRAKADRRSEQVHQIRLARLRQGLDLNTERGDLDE